MVNSVVNWATISGASSLDFTIVRLMLHCGAAVFSDLVPFLPSRILGAPRWAAEWSIDSVDAGV